MELSFLHVSNAYMKQFGTFPQALAVPDPAVPLPPIPPLTFPFSHLGPGQVVVEVIQLIGLLLQGSLQPEDGPNPRSLPQGVPLLHQSEELSKGLMITILQHIHTDGLLVRVPVTSSSKRSPMCPRASASFFPPSTLIS